MYFEQSPLATMLMELLEAKDRAQMWQIQQAFPNQALEKACGCVFKHTL